MRRYPLASRLLRRRAWAASSLLLSLWVGIGSSAARDLETLSRILIPAYVAQNFAAACVVHDPSFLDGTAGPHGHVHVFAKHVRDEVIAHLDEKSTETVLRMSADTAIALARKELGQLRFSSFREESNQLLIWCEKSAKPFVQQIMAVHATEHVEIDRILAEAKNE